MDYLYENLEDLTDKDFGFLIAMTQYMWDAQYPALSLEYRKKVDRWWSLLEAEAERRGKLMGYCVDLIANA